ncbi:MAG: sigma-70 family RNA polymerase sigma factor [Gammaproteobacteria bacterium]|nr:MAG: sigma-70 family RNA polymerase sigma factor [Gammaproteobacteria bacterium]
MNQLTELLGRLRAGDAGARNALFAAAYAELHRLARSRLRDGGRNTVLDTTGLVHESFLRFVSGGALRAEDRRAFFAYASQVMRSVIVNSARERIAQRRGGDLRPLTLSTQLPGNAAENEETILSVHQALEALEQADPRLAEVAQMRYFGGYSEQEIAETLGVTERTVQRDWEKAQIDVLGGAAQPFARGTDEPVDSADGAHEPLARRGAAAGCAGAAALARGAFSRTPVPGRSTARGALAGWGRRPGRGARRRRGERPRPDRKRSTAWRNRGPLPGHPAARRRRHGGGMAGGARRRSLQA